PGDPVDYSYLKISEAGAQPRPDEACAAADTAPLCTDLIRVLGDDHRAVGPWDPKLDAETLRRMLRTMALTRAFDERMYRGQRQGKTSFYMQCTGEEATSVAAAMALASDDMVLPGYRQQGILIARAIGYGVAGLGVDGNDARAVYAVEQWAANRARANMGPTLIEHFTYRAEGHSPSDDPSQYRSAQEREEWPLGDPITRLKRHL